MVLSNQTKTVTIGQMKGTESRTLEYLSLANVFPDKNGALMWGKPFVKQVDIHSETSRHVSIQKQPENRTHKQSEEISYCLKVAPPGGEVTEPLRSPVGTQIKSKFQRGTAFPILPEEKLRDPINAKIITDIELLEEMEAHLNNEQKDVQQNKEEEEEEVEEENKEASMEDEVNEEEGIDLEENNQEKQQVNEREEAPQTNEEKSDEPEENSLEMEIDVELETEHIKQKQKAKKKFENSTTGEKNTSSTTSKARKISEENEISPPKRLHGASKAQMTKTLGAKNKTVKTNSPAPPKQKNQEKKNEKNGSTPTCNKSSESIDRSH